MGLGVGVLLSVGICACAGYKFWGVLVTREGYNQLPPSATMGVLYCRKSSLPCQLITTCAQKWQTVRQPWLVASCTDGAEQH